MEKIINPDPDDPSVLWNQNNHIFTRVWEDNAIVVLQIV